MKKENVIVSIVVPCFNQEPYIEACIKSLINQTLTNIEIIFVDDFSTDRTVSIINRYAKKDKRIKLIKFKENLGTCMARKEAVKASIGKYIMFCDSDDEFELNACEKAVELIKKHNVDILQFGTNIINCGASEKSMNWFTNFSRPLNEKIEGEDVYFKCFKEKKYSFNLWNKIYNGTIVRKAFEYIKEGYYPKAQDMYAFNNIAYFSKSYFGVDNKLYNYFYGRGITANNKIPLKKFQNITTQSKIIELVYKFFDDVSSNNVELYLNTILGYSTSFTNEIISSYEKIENLPENKDKAISMIINNLTPIYSSADFKNTEIYNEYFHSLLNSLNILFNKFEDDNIERYVIYNLSNFDIFIKKIDFFKTLNSSVSKLQMVNPKLKMLINFCAESEYLKGYNKKSIIPIVFATNDNYAPFLSVAIESLKESAKQDNFYDIYIFNSGLSLLTQYKLKQSEENNIHIRFVDVSSLIKTNSLYERDYFSVEMYYRLLIAEILFYYNKVIYLDCDIVVLHDVADLYKIDLENYVLGVVNDKVFSSAQKDYVNNGIGIGEENYFNSGILLIDTKKFIELTIKEKCFEVLSRYKKLSCPDQDALNISCQGKVLYLTDSWNFQNGRGSYTFEDRYNKVHNIIHYTSAKKPWNTKVIELGEYFWKYARNTIFYEEILSDYILKTTNLQQITNNKNKQETNTLDNVNKNNHYEVINPERQNHHKKPLVTWPFRMVGKFFDSWKNDGLKTTLKTVKIKIKYIFNRMLGRVDKYNNNIIKYKCIKEKKLTDKEIEKKLDKVIEKNGKKPDIIVSLTSYPARIKTIHKVIESIKKQTLKPKKIILWLAEKQFPNKEKDLPKELLKHVDKMFEIRWCEDIRSYKKLIPTLELYPNSYIVTVDDDNIYSPYLLKRLYADSLNNPKCIIAHRITKFFINEKGEFKIIPGGKDYYHTPSYLNKLVGVGGVLYPPKSLYKDISNKKLFWNLAQTNDDQWFWFMGILNGYRVKVCEYPLIDLNLIENTQETALCNINDHGENLFWVQFNNLIKHYPKVKNLLIHEFYLLAKNNLNRQNFGSLFDKLKMQTREIDYKYYETLPIENYPIELQKWYNKRTESNMDINNPKSLNEKIQWIKMYDSTLIKSQLTDKWLAKEYIKSILGEQYIIKTLGVYENFEDIDFDKLPNKFVIKSTHGSGQIIIVKDKQTINKLEIKEKVSRWLSKNYAYSCGLEIHYGNIIPRIIIEEFEEGFNNDLYDYKFMCINGKVEFIWVDCNRFTNHTRNIYDANWNLLPIKYQHDNCKNKIPRPKMLKQIIKLSEKLSKDFALVRCDYYILPDDSIKFGELTFTSASGIDKWEPKTFDYKFGELLKLPKPSNFKKYTKEELLKEENKFLKSLKKSR